MADTHICPKCSQPCVYQHGIMCTIQGCIKDGTSKQNDMFSALFNRNGKNDNTVDSLKSIFGMK